MTDRIRYVYREVFHEAISWFAKHRPTHRKEFSPTLKKSTCKKHGVDKFPLKREQHPGDFGVSSLFISNFIPNKVYQITTVCPKKFYPLKTTFVREPFTNTKTPTKKSSAFMNLENSRCCQFPSTLPLKPAVQNHQNTRFSRHHQNNHFTRQIWWHGWRLYPSPRSHRSAIGVCEASTHQVCP